MDHPEFCVSHAFEFTIVPNPNKYETQYNKNNKGKMHQQNNIRSKHIFVVPGIQVVTLLERCDRQKAWSS
jgi:hypothetical protein